MDFITSRGAGDSEEDTDFEARLAKLKKRPTASKAAGDAQTPYQQLKQNQAEQKERIVGAQPRTRPHP